MSNDNVQEYLLYLKDQMAAVMDQWPHRDAQMPLDNNLMADVYRQSYPQNHHSPNLSQPEHQQHYTYADPTQLSSQRIDYGLTGTDWASNNFEEQSAAGILQDLSQEYFDNNGEITPPDQAFFSHHHRHDSHSGSMAGNNAHPYPVAAPMSAHSSRSSMSAISPHSIVSANPFNALQPQDLYNNDHNNINNPSPQPQPTIQLSSPATTRKATTTQPSPSKKTLSTSAPGPQTLPDSKLAPPRRKRQRIPHTDVERRYRENLNAHLDRLRCIVPAPAGHQISRNGNTNHNRNTSGGKGVRKTSTGAAGTKGGGENVVEGLKLSKCEVINAAIEHIGHLDAENRMLREELEGLKGRAGEWEERLGAGTVWGFQGTTATTMG